MLEESIKEVFKDMNCKNCSAVCYSEGGHLLAAGNSNLIHVYETNTFDLLVCLPGHAGHIKDL